MRYVCALALLIAAPLAQPQQKGQQKEKKAATQSITGCLDEKSDYYVIRSEEAMRELAALEPVGFEKQLFARFVGHKVTVTGELVTTNDPPTLKVKSYSNIKDIAETCAPGDK
jgi:hypothetical protein